MGLKLAEICDLRWNIWIEKQYILQRSKSVLSNYSHQHLYMLNSYFFLLAVYFSNARTVIWWDDVGNPQKWLVICSHLNKQTEGFHLWGVAVISSEITAAASFGSVSVTHLFTKGFLSCSPLQVGCNQSDMEMVGVADDCMCRCCLYVFRCDTCTCLPGRCRPHPAHKCFRFWFWSGQEGIANRTAPEVWWKCPTDSSHSAPQVGLNNYVDLNRWVTSHFDTYHDTRLTV